MKKLLLSIIVLATYVSATAQCSDLFISEYVEGSGNNKAFEIYNPTNCPINLNNQYRLIRYSNGQSEAAGNVTPNAPINLGTHVIGPHVAWVIVLDRLTPPVQPIDGPIVDAALQMKADTFLCPDYNISYAMYINGNDAEALQKTTNGGTTWNDVDIFGMIGDANMVGLDGTGGWNPVFPYYALYESAWTYNHTLIRHANVLSGVTVNPNPFIVSNEWDSLVVNTFDSLRTHTCNCTTIPPAPTATANVSYCLGATASALSAVTAGCYSLNWYTVPTGGTASATAPTPSTSVAGTTTYYVSESYMGGTESNRTSITVTVNPLPTAPIITPGGPTSFCTGGTVVLTSSYSTGNIWSTTASTQSITVNSTGNYTVTETDVNGCQSTSAPISVNVSNAPLPTVTVTGGVTICQGQSTTLTASTADSYLWSPNGETTQSITVTATGTYYVTTTNANPCNGVGQSSSTVVTVNPLPTAVGGHGTINGFSVHFTNSSTGATSYYWNFGDASNSTQDTITHVYSTSGTYTVMLIAFSGACSDTVTFTVTIAVGIETNTAIKGFTIYPNPVNQESTTIEINLSAMSKVAVSIYDITGREVKRVYNSEMNAGKTKLNVDVTELPAGIYFASFISNNMKKTLKMTVVK